MALSGITGFLDGYKARNIATNKVTIDFHLEEIIRLIDFLKKEPEVLEKAEAIFHLDSALSLLRTNISTVDPTKYFDNSKRIGQSLISFLDEGIKFQEASRTILKKIIFHYLNLAKKMEEDNSIVRLATEIATKFNK